MSLRLQRLEQHVEILGGDQVTVRCGAFEQMIGEAALAFLQGENFLFDGTLRQQLVDEHRFVLTDAMSARRGLFLDGRIPPRIVMDHAVGGGQVEPGTAGLGGMVGLEDLAQVLGRDAAAGVGKGRDPWSARSA